LAPFYISIIVCKTTSRVWKNQALSLAFWIPDSCNVYVNDKKHIIQK
jgi:hypothetical protein